MTLTTALIAGLACGYLLGRHPRAFVVFGTIWGLVLAVQTLFVLKPERLPPADWLYVPVQATILCIGIAMLWLGSRLRAKFTRAV